MLYLSYDEFRHILHLGMANAHGGRRLEQGPKPNSASKNLSAVCGSKLCRLNAFDITFWNQSVVHTQALNRRVRHSDFD